MEKTFECFMKNYLHSPACSTCAWKLICEQSKARLEVREERRPYGILLKADAIIWSEEAER